MAYCSYKFSHCLVFWSNMLYYIVIYFDLAIFLPLFLLDISYLCNNPISHSFASTQLNKKKQKTKREIHTNWKEIFNKVKEVTSQSEAKKHTKTIVPYRLDNYSWPCGLSWSECVWNSQKHIIGLPLSTKYQLQYITNIFIR